MTDLLEMLNESIVAAAFERNEITDMRLAERLIWERKSAAARIAALEAALNGAEQAMTVASQALNLYQAINPYDGVNRARHAKAEIHGSLAIVRAALGEKE